MTSNESQDKKDTVPDVPSAKSYSSESVTAELDRSALQAHAISPELLQPMPETELPQLEPEYLLDTSTANPNDVALPASTPAATTQPSLRRMQRALLPEPPARRGRGVQVLLVLLGLAIIWEVAMLVRTSLGARENQATLRGQPGPSASVQVSSARPNVAETSEPAAAELPAPTTQQATAEESPVAAEKPADEPSAAAARNSSGQANAPRVPALLQDLEPAVRQEAIVRPKLEGAEAPPATSSSKSPSKVLFPPQ